MSGPRSVLLLCWRDTGHPQGGGSETYLQRIGAQLAASGIDVTLRTARYAGAPRREIVDGVRISRAGGRYSVYVWALLAMAFNELGARIGLGPLRRVRPDVVVDTQNGLPFLARLVYGRRVVVLVHHCHREQWPVAGPVLGRLGWFVESRLSPRLNRRNQYVTVSLPSARDLVALGVGNGPPRRAGAPGGGAARARAASGGALAAGTAQADRGCAGGGGRVTEADTGPAPRHRR
jgi:hypothetical protein